MANPLERALGAPAELLEALRHIPEMAGHTGEMAKRMAGLDRGMKSIGKQTASLPAVEEELQGILGKIEVMDGRMAQIADTMPVLVEVQTHIARLPEMMDGLDEQLASLSTGLERLLESLEGFSDNLATLQGSIEPLGRLAGRMPGGRAGRRARAEALAEAEEAAEAEEDPAEAADEAAAN